MDYGDFAKKFETIAVSHGEAPDHEPGVGDVVSPIHLASTYALDELDTSKALEGGEHALAFASGTAAIATTILAAVEPGSLDPAFV